MNPPRFRRNPSVFGMLVLAAVMVTLAGCDPELVFDNEYDPQASNSPLSSSIQNLFAWYYMDGTNGKVVEFGWDRVPQAISYEYEVVPLYWRDETGSEAFQLVASGDRGLIAEGSVAQTLEGNHPSERLPSDDGVYALRVRYLATATNKGVTSDAWSPWSSPEERWVGVPRYYWRTEDLFRDDQVSGRFDFRGDRYVFQVDFQGQGAAGNTMFLFIEDEFSGYENGASPYIWVYDADNSFDGPFLEGSFKYDKSNDPISFEMPSSERLYIMLETENPDDTFFEIRIAY